MTEQAGVKLIIRAADGQTLCRHVVACCGQEDCAQESGRGNTNLETEAEENSISQEGSPNNESLPQDLPVPNTIQVPTATPKRMVPVIAISKMKVKKSEVPQPRKRSARLMMKEAVVSQERATDDVTDEELKEALRDGGTATSSSEDEDEERSDPDYVPK